MKKCVNEMRTNYHTHTERCNHAIGSDEEFVLSAIAGEYEILGFSDHTPWGFKDGYVSNIRMDVSELDGYVASVRSLKEKYADKIEIKIGLECEYYTDYIGWLKEQKERLQLDYLLFGNHFPYDEYGLYFGHAQTKSDLDLYLKSSVEALESGLFDCFAHPDLFMRSYPQVDSHCKNIFRELSRTARDTGVVMEFNTSLTYNRELWEIVAEEQPKVIIGLDCHQAHLLYDNTVYDDARRTLKLLGINLIKTL